MANTELCFLNVTELAPLLRARKLSPVEIVHALLERIDTLNDDLIAYLHISAEHALAAAQAAEIEIGSGGYRGPLHGIPVAYKDIYDVQGMPSTVIIDRKGNIRVLHRGYKPGDENEYLDSIRSLVRE